MPGATVRDVRILVRELVQHPSSVERVGELLVCEGVQRVGGDSGEVRPFGDKHLFQLQKHLGFVLPRANGHEFVLGILEVEWARAVGVCKVVWMGPAVEEHLALRIDGDEVAAMESELRRGHDLGTIITRFHFWTVRVEHAGDAWVVGTEIKDGDFTATSGTPQRRVP